MRPGAVGRVKETVCLLPIICKSSDRQPVDCEPSGCLGCYGSRPIRSDRCLDVKDTDYSNRMWHDPMICSIIHAGEGHVCGTVGGGNNEYAT